ncbi:MAG: hypothetical protein JRM77_02175 [Nitrososphaerota archaeon]|nr:hypothetical protein [Nitrososphaerota archaeon]
MARKPNLRGRQARAPPKVTTFECIHAKLAPGSRHDGDAGAAEEGFLFCKNCFGYWNPLIGWTREPRRVKSLMKDDGVVRSVR